MGECAQRIRCCVKVGGTNYIRAVPRRTSAAAAVVEPAREGYSARLTDNAAYLLARLGQETVRVFSLSLAPAELAPREWGLLEVLDERGPGTQTDLSARLRLDRGDMTRFVERLHERGLLASERAATDRRAKHVALTAAGRDALKRARPLAAEAERLALPGLTDDEQTELRRLLAKVAAHRWAVDRGSPTSPARASTRSTP